MSIAFYAPLKAPGHPVPSGDRRMARLLMRALAATGEHVMLASTLRSWDGSGDRGRQERIRALGVRMGERLLRRYRAGHRPSAWFTYHLYHKAPDWLGPRVSRALGIPYVVAEASVAPRQAEGAWQLGYEAVLEALASANAVVALNPRDLACVQPVLGPCTRLYELRPFLEPVDPGLLSDRSRRRDRTARRLGLDTGRPWLLAVAMFRRGDKLASFRVLGHALERIRHMPWQLVVVGDGPARDDVQTLLAGFGPRVLFTGVATQDALGELYRCADVLVWPAVNEAYGMALLEAQSAGLPVVAGRREGVAEVVSDGETGVLTPEGDASAFAAALGMLLEQPVRRRGMARAAARRAVAERRFEKAVSTLKHMLDGLRS